MPKIIIDEQEIEVPSGTKVIEAAERLGIMIPRFCYHPALGSVGACRVCAVKFLQGPFKGLQMSCMVDAVDGMVISTTDAEAVDFRKHVIEWLMLNHPHDCPVCDEGGRCLLQDMTVSGGHGIRRFPGKKRTHYDQYLGPLVQHEMNRCIQCYRCSRFYQEFTGYRDLGVMQIGSRVYFGRYKAGTLESPFAGNLIDICPTGVYTDKPSRFKGRYWDYERGPSLCIHCSLGCHTTVNVRYRDVVRQEARYSPLVNGYFICDRGRYGFDYASQDQRPRQARIDGQEALWQTSLQTAMERLDRIGREFGPAAIACVGSFRNSLETQAALKLLCTTKGWQGPIYWMDQESENRVKTAVSRLEADLAVSLAELENADYILALGMDPVNEAPMLSLAMRQAQRRGAKVVLMDPRPVLLPFDFQHLAVAPGDMDDYLAFLMKAAVDRDPVTSSADADRIPQNYREKMAALGKDLLHSVRPVVVCGTEVVSETLPALAADYVRLLKTTRRQAGLFYLMPGANAFGAVLLSSAGASFEPVLAGIESGTVKALLLVENDLYGHFPDRKRLERAFKRLELLIVVDYLDSRAARAADVFLPALSVFETGGLFVNQEGRVQKAQGIYQGGRPIALVGGGSHPPRTFSNTIPGAEARAAWQVLTAFIGGPLQVEHRETPVDPIKLLAEAQPLFSELGPLDAFPVDGFRVAWGEPAGFGREPERSAEKIRSSQTNGGLQLITVEWTFGTEELSSRSPFLRQMEKDPCVFMHSHDAARLGISSGQNIAIRSPAGTLKVQVNVVGNMAGGILVLPRHHKLGWQELGASRMLLREDQIVRLQEDQ